MKRMKPISIAVTLNVGLSHAIEILTRNAVKTRYVFSTKIIPNAAMENVFLRMKIVHAEMMMIVMIQITFVANQLNSVYLLTNVKMYLKGVTLLVVRMMNSAALPLISANLSRRIVDANLILLEHLHLAQSSA